MIRPFCKILNVHIKDDMYISIMTTRSQVCKLDKFLYIANITYVKLQVMYSDAFKYKCYVHTKKEFYRLINQIKEWDKRYNILTDCDLYLKQYLELLDEKESIA
jgi:hypothetical protein